MCAGLPLSTKLPERFQASPATALVDPGEQYEQKPVAQARRDLAGLSPAQRKARKGKY